MDWIEGFPYAWDPETDSYESMTGLFQLGFGYWGYIDKAKQYIDVDFSTGNFDIDLENKTITTTVEGINFDGIMAYIYNETTQKVVFPKQKLNIQYQRSGGISIQVSVPALEPSCSYFVQVSPITKNVEGKPVSCRIFTDAYSSTVHILEVGALKDATPSWDDSTLRLGGMTGDVQWKAVVRNGSTTIAADTGTSSANDIVTGFTLNDGDYIIISVRSVDGGTVKSVWRTFSSKNQVR